MQDFLDVAERLWSYKAIDESKKGHFERVFQAISHLQAVHSKSEFDLINIESIFTALELSKTLGRLPGFDPKEIDGLINDLKSVIVTTLEQTVTFPVSGGGVIGPIWNLSNPSKRQLKARAGRQLPSFPLTTTLLLILLCSLEAISGSTMALRRSHKGISQRKKELANIGKTPVIVPPSWNKADSHRAVAKVWARAAEELSEADSIYIIGYSLPATDSFFHHLYALGSVGSTLLKRFWVFNPDTGREGVFRSMLGPGARSRFKFFEQRFSTATRTIAKALE